MGFRIGVGKKVGGVNFFFSKSLSGSTKKATTKGPSATELKDKEFSDFLHKTQKDSNHLIMDFFELNGYNPSRLSKEKIDIDDLFENDESYELFSELALNLKEQIEKVDYSGDTGIQAKRDIAEKLFALKGFINRFERRDHINPKYAFLKEPEAPLVQNNSSVINSLSGISSVTNNNIDILSIVKKIGLVCFWLALFLMPYIFSWFTLSNKFTKKQRIIAFVWMVVVLVIVLSGNK